MRFPGYQSCSNSFIACIDQFASALDGERSLLNMRAVCSTVAETYHQLRISTESPIQDSKNPSSRWSRQLLATPVSPTDDTSATWWGRISSPSEFIRSLKNHLALNGEPQFTPMRSISVCASSTRRLPHLPPSHHSATAPTVLPTDDSFPISAHTQTFPESLPCNTPDSHLVPHPSFGRL